MMRGRLLRGLTACLVLVASPAAAEEWYEAYHSGLGALARGQPARAISFLERAAELRPEPGRNVVTYGTNVEARYYPYLRLAEAYIAVADHEGARSALRRSETWKKEPADERAQLVARLEAAMPRPAAAPPTTLPAAPPTSEPAVPSPATTVITVASAPPAVVPSLLPPAVPAPAVKVTPVPRSTTTTLPAVPQSAGAPSAATGTLEILSQPPGASVYLNDELLGTTDSEWGRLVKTGIPAGHHRVRMSLAGHADVLQDVDVATSGPTSIRGRLSPVREDGRPILFGVLAAVLAVIAVWALRRPRYTPSADTPRHHAAPTGPTPARGTPPAGAPAPRDFLPGERFGEYTILEPLGRGGMAAVYKAERHGEVCALKRPLPAFLDEQEFLERFLREAELGRSLHHPNIVRILERGAVGGIPYFTMELVTGETLQQHLRRAVPEPRAAAAIVVQVAEALDYAHLKGVVHRDLKPSNIAVLEDGTVRVMDVGIARARRFAGLTVTGAFLGSPEYVAPEIIDGRGADARSDLYSLGVVLYEALTGRRPFAADTPFAILQKHLSEQPVRPSVLRPGLPAELERITLRLLAKDPADRHAEAEALVVELREFLNRAA
jgi:serine/threonine-protein kinase